MRRLLRKATILLVGLLFVGASQYSARTQTQTPGVIRVSVNLVQVDAVVTDSKGRKVTDLRPEDLEIFQDGQPQKLTHFEFVNLRDEAPSAPVLTVSTRREGPDAVPPPPTRRALEREEIRRTFAFVIDDLALSFDSVVRVRAALKKWVEAEMRPGDLVAVIRTSAGMGSLQRFTLDKQGLSAAIETIKYQPGRLGVSSFAAAQGEVPDGPDKTYFEDELEHAYLVGSLGAIQYVVRGLRDLPGRKSLVLFSESMKFTFIQGSGIKTASLSSATGEERIRRLADEAARAGVVINAVDPRGVVNTAWTAEDNLNGLIKPIFETNAAGEQVVVGQDYSGFGQVVADRSQQLIESRDGMVVLTQKTGGLFVKDNNDLSTAVRSTVDDGDGYYLLGYQPDLFTFDEANKRAFHSIRVSVKRPGLTVRSRTGFFGKADDDPSVAPPTPTEQLVKALVSPFTTNDVDVRLTAFYSPQANGAASINTLLHIDAHDVTFSEEPDGSRTAQLDVVVVTFDGDGRQVDMLPRTWKISVSSKALDTIQTNGLMYWANLPVKKPGAYQLRVAARDSATKRLGTAMQYIEVPDLKQGRLAMSGIVMAGQDRENGESTAARRIFKNGMAVTYGYEILNARSDASKKPQLEARIRLYREGQQIYSDTGANLVVDAKDPKRVTTGGTLQLKQLSPGDYVLQIIVADNMRFDKYRIASQSIDFQVRR